MKLFATKIQQESASQIFIRTCEINDGSFIFSTCARKGYGRQTIKVSQVPVLYQLLAEAENHDCFYLKTLIEKKAGKGIKCEADKPEFWEIVTNTLMVTGNGEIKFRTSLDKGQKPCLFLNETDFSEWLDELAKACNIVTERHPEYAIIPEDFDPDYLEG